MDDNFYKNLAQSVFDAMNNNNLGSMEPNVNESVIFDFPGSGRIEGAKRVILFLTVLLRKYKSLTFDVQEIITEGERACAIWSNKGELKDGTPYANQGITLFYFTDKKIQFMSDYFKDTSFTQNK